MDFWTKSFQDLERVECSGCGLVVIRLPAAQGPGVALIWPEGRPHRQFSHEFPGYLEERNGELQCQDCSSWEGKPARFKWFRDPHRDVKAHALAKFRIAVWETTAGRRFTDAHSAIWDRKRQQPRPAGLSYADELRNDLAQPEWQEAVTAFLAGLNPRAEHLLSRERVDYEFYEPLPSVSNMMAQLEMRVDWKLFSTFEELLEFQRYWLRPVWDQYQGKRVKGFPNLERDVRWLVEWLIEAKTDDQIADEESSSTGRSLSAAAVERARRTVGILLDILPPRRTRKQTGQLPTSSP